PPSAWITSKSMEICRSPSLGRSTTARSARPIRRWISCVRPEGWPAVASRRVRSVVARGSMPYSAVTQPRPCPLSQGGMRSSTLAVQLTCVLPNLMRQEPSACIDTARSIDTRRSSSGLRFEGRMGGGRQPRRAASRLQPQKVAAEGEPMLAIRSALGDHDLQVLARDDHGAVLGAVHLADQGEHVVPEALLGPFLECGEGLEHGTVVGL